MGGVASFYIEQEASKPVDASDVTDLEQARSELNRLRKILHSATYTFPLHTLQEKLAKATEQAKVAADHLKVIDKPDLWCEAYTIFADVSGIGIAVLSSVEETTILQSEAVASDKEDFTLLVECVHDVFGIISESVNHFTIKLLTQGIVPKELLSHVPKTTNEVKGVLHSEDSKSSLTDCTKYSLVSDIESLEYYKALQECTHSDVSIVQLSWNWLLELDCLCELNYVMCEDGSVLVAQSSSTQNPLNLHHALLVNKLCDFSEFNDNKLIIAGTIFIHRDSRHVKTSIRTIFVTSCSPCYPSFSTSFTIIVQQLVNIIPEESQATVLSLPCFGKYCSFCQVEECSSTTRSESAKSLLQSWHLVEK